MNKKVTFYTFAVGTFFFWVFFPQSVFAQSASLYLTPTTGTFPIGEQFVVEVRIDTGGSSVGTADAVIAYNPEDLRFESVSDDGSIFSTILVDSTRKSGNIDLSGFTQRGVTPYAGGDGLFARIVFTPLRNVATQLYFTQGSATKPLSLTASVADLTNMVTGLRTASYTFIPKQVTTANVVYAEGGETQSTFEITPLPVPQGEWFSSSTVTLSWTLPEGVEEMRSVVSDSQNDIPSKTYATPVTSVTLKDLSQGKHFFLLQFKRKGVWEDVIRHPLSVDYSKPSEISIKETEREDSADPRVTFAIEASDSNSGIERYEMSIDGGEGEVWEKKDGELYEPKGLTPGEHVLTVIAYDKAGNSTTKDALFIVKSLEAPALINESVPERVLSGDTVTVRGTSYPNSEVTVFISFNDGEADEKKVKTDERGEFTVTITEGARTGKYTLWFTVTDERGAMSPNSIKRSIDVSQPYIMLFGSYAVTYLSVIVPLVALILLLGLVLWLAFTWVRGYRKRVRLETNEAYHATKEEFYKLREELTKQIGMLEKANMSRELTREEMRIFNDLSKRLDNMENRIVDEIEDVERVEEEEKEIVRKRSVEGSLEKYRKKVQVDSSPFNSSHTIRL